MGLCQKDSFMPRPNPLSLGLALLAGCATSATALADSPRYNQVALSASVEQDVAHDLMHVTLYTEAQDNDPAKLATAITQTLNQSLEKARQAKDVSVRLGGRNSYPVYDDKGQRITAWRERAEIRLEGADFAKLSTLTGELLGTLKMGGMDFSIADPTRKTREEALIKDAVAAFRARAQLTTEALGGTGYKLVSLNLNTGGFHPRAPMMAYAAKQMSPMADSAPPQIEAGSSQVTVSADGVIEVLMP